MDGRRDDGQWSPGWMNDRGKGTQTRATVNGREPHLSCCDRDTKISNPPQPVSPASQIGAPFLAFTLCTAFGCFVLLFLILSFHPSLPSLSFPHCRTHFISFHFIPLFPVIVFIVSIVFIVETSPVITSLHCTALHRKA